MHKDAWKSLSSKIVYENKYGRKIREHKVIRPNGKEGVYAVMEVPPGVIILAVTNQKEFYLIGQYRFPIAQYSLELPSGGVDEGESVEIAAQRELQEETGLIAEKWTELGELCFSTGSSNERSTVFLAQDLRNTNHNEQQEEGIAEVQKVSFPEFMDLAKKGKVIDSSSIASVMLALDHLK